MGSHVITGITSTSIPVTGRKEDDSLKSQDSIVSKPVDEASLNKVEPLTYDGSEVKGVVSYTSSEELMSSTSEGMSSGVPVLSNMEGQKLEDEQRMFDKKELLKSNNEYSKVLKKIIENGKEDSDALKSALAMSLSGVDSLATNNSNLVNIALKQDSLKHLTRMDKLNSAILNPSNVDSSKLSNKMLSMALVATARPTETQSAQSSSRYQQQPKDSLNDIKSVNSFMQEGNQILDNLAKESKHLNDKKNVTS